MAIRKKDDKPKGLPTAIQHLVDRCLFWQQSKDYADKQYQDLRKDLTQAIEAEPEDIVAVGTSREHATGTILYSTARASANLARVIDAVHGGRLTWEQVLNIATVSATSLRELGLADCVDEPTDKPLILTLRASSEYKALCRDLITAAEGQIPGVLDPEREAYHVAA